MAKKENMSPTKSKCANTKLAPLPEASLDIVLEQVEKNRPVRVEILQRALVSSHFFLRARAAQLLGKLKHHPSIPFLIATLRDDSEHLGANYSEAGMNSTRYWANDSLKKITNQDFGFVWNASLADREGAIKKWEEWYEASCVD